MTADRPRFPLGAEAVIFIGCMVREVFSVPTWMNQKELIMRHVLSIGLAVVGITLFAGCDSGEPVNVVENADAQAMEDYDAMIAADNEMMSEDPSDSSDEGDAAPAE